MAGRVKRAQAAKVTQNLQLKKSKKTVAIFHYNDRIYVNFTNWDVL